MGTAALNVVGPASARIVVQATEQDKRAIAAKAKKLDLPVSELMRRGAFAYESAEIDAEFGALAIAAETAAQRSAEFIDEALDFIEASNKRIAKMEAQAAKAKRKAA
jgi:hypothetical protein